MVEWAARLRRREAVDLQDAVHPLDQAYRDNLEAIYRHIYRKVGNRETAEDLTAEVFLKAARWLETERSPQAVQAWLYATARTTVVDYWQTYASPTVDISTLREILANPELGEQPAVGSGEARAQRLLEGLPERERRVLVLRFLRGYTAAEIAQELNTSEGNVRVLQHRALRRAALVRETNDE